MASDLPSTVDRVAFEAGTWVEQPAVGPIRAEPGVARRRVTADSPLFLHAPGTRTSSGYPTSNGSRRGARSGRARATTPVSEVCVSCEALLSSRRQPRWGTGGLRRQTSSRCPAHRLPSSTESSIGARSGRAGQQEVRWRFSLVTCTVKHRALIPVAASDRYDPSFYGDPCERLGSTAACRGSSPPIARS
jgi:hypothetical protein